LVLSLALISAASTAFAAGTPTGIVVTPLVSFPIGQSAELYSTGYGASLSADFPILPALSLEGGIRYSIHPTKAQSSLSLIGLGGGIGTSFRVLPVLNLDAALNIGVYGAVYGPEFAANPYASADAAARFAFSPSFSFAAGAGYDYFLTRSNGTFAALYSGIRATVGLQFQPGMTSQAPATPHLKEENPFYRPIFPVFFKYYDRNAFGKIVLRNEEKDAISNVTVSVLVDQYMSGPRVTATFPRIGRGETVEVPLTALFTNAVLDITEPTSVSIKVSTDYTLNGAQLSVSRSDTLRVLDRNALTWDDDRKVVSFVTSRDPTVLQFARQVTSATREVGSSEVNEKLRTAMAMFTALTLYGIDYAVDPKSSYADLSQSDSTVDYVQFPVQTLQFKAGDCDDLSVLFNALLEAVGVETAFITIPGHIYMAYNLGMTAEEARRTFGDTAELIEHGGSMWMPVEVTLVRQDFLQAWAVGAKEWRDAQRAGKAAFYPVREAWQTYEPTGFSSASIAIPMPAESRVSSAYSDRLSQFIERQITPQVNELKARITESGNNPRVVNRLGTVYARYGLLDRALVEFRKAAAKNYAPALINIANVMFVRKDYAGALAGYKRASRVDPTEPLATVGIARTEFEMGAYADAQSSYRQAVALAPEVAAPYSYIVSENHDVGRASSATSNNRVQWGD
jgi:tetratricopeptide (TPR) repeat protein